MALIPRWLALAILTLLVVVFAGGCGGGEAEGDGQTPATKAASTPTAAASTGTAGADGLPGGGPLRYAVIGDSNSNGENAGPGGAASPDQAAWPAQLAKRLTAEGLAVELVANPAITGATIEQAVAEELQTFEDARPDVATLMIGNNDWVAGVTPADFRTRFGGLLDRMIQIVGGPDRVITLSLTAFYVTPGGQAYVGGRDAVAGIAESDAIVREQSEDAGVTYVSIFDLTEAMGDDPSLVAPDGLHASEKELSLWVDRIAPIALERWSSLAE